MKTKFKIRTRDWKGAYSSNVKGWKLLAAENKIQTGGDSFAEVFYKGTPIKEFSGQDIYDIWESLSCGETEEGWDIDEKDEKILIKL